jgi:hypothetical protein
MRTTIVDREDATEQVSIWELPGQAGWKVARREGGTDECSAPSDAWGKVNVAASRAPRLPEPSVVNYQPCDPENLGQLRAFERAKPDWISAEIRNWGAGHSWPPAAPVQPSGRR